MRNTVHPLPATESIPLDKLIKRATYGDEDAVAMLLSEYSVVIARELRTQRRFYSLKSVVDSDDIVQSVWRGFFTALNQGNATFTDPGAVAAFLIKVTQNRIESQFRKQFAIKRDIRRTVSSADLDIADKTNLHPAHALSVNELLTSVLQQMTPEERQVSNRRAEGATWEALAIEMNCSAEALRKRHTRTAARILGELQADDGKA